MQVSRTDRPLYMHALQLTPSRGQPLQLHAAPPRSSCQACNQPSSRARLDPRHRNGLVIPDAIPPPHPIPSHLSTQLQQTTRRTACEPKKNNNDPSPTQFPPPGHHGHEPPDLPLPAPLPHRRPLDRARSVACRAQLPPQAVAAATVIRLLPTCRAVHDTLGREAGCLCQAGREGHRASSVRRCSGTAAERRREAGRARRGKGHTTTGTSDTAATTTITTTIITTTKRSPSSPF
jgi:hypothetical protein